MKFGGTSVADADAFRRVAALVRKHEGARPVVVVSAMCRVTDALLACVQSAAEGNAEEAARSLAEHFERHLNVARTLLQPDTLPVLEGLIEGSRAEVARLLCEVAGETQSLAQLQDEIVAYGERLSATLLAAVLREHKVAARYVDARRCVVTDGEHGRATPLKDETERRTREEVEPLLEAGEVPVLGGFIASTG
ncbi:MAG: lysine-sensitive aspartokinase 3, partial [Acidobacteria bacterium]|nr:lysine-sensitive aspartokinase 3 [Acidobacteriota bacterium]